MVSARRSVLFLLVVLGAGCSSDPVVVPSVGRDDASPVGFNTSYPNSPTPLSHAVMDDDVALVRALLDSGADPNARWTGTGDRYPLLDAIDGGPSRHQLQQRDAIVRLLLAHGADPHLRHCPYESRRPAAELPACTNGLGMTPLMMAALNDRVDAAYRLLDAGARPLDVEWFDGTALDIARTDLMFELLLAAAYPGPDGERQAATDLLARAGLPANEAHRLGTQPYMPMYGLMPLHGRTRLMLAAMDMAGLDASAREQGLRVPLLLAVFGATMRTDLTVLLEAGANPNGRACLPVGRGGNTPSVAPECDDTNGVTPLMYSATFGRMADRILKEYGGDPTLTDWAGRTADDYQRLRLSTYPPSASLSRALEPHGPSRAQ